MSVSKKTFCFQNKPCLIFVILLFLIGIIFSTPVFAYAAFDDNYLVEADGFYDAATVATDGGINARVIITSQPTGTFSNSTDKTKIGVYFDDNAPTVSITYPTDGKIFTSKNIPCTYLAADASLVVKYYVKLDDSQWIDNGLNKGYLFNNLAAGKHTFFVKVIDAFGLIGQASTIIYINQEQTNNGGGGGGGSTGGEPDVTDITKEYVQEFELTEKNMSPTSLNELGRDYLENSRIAQNTEVKLTRTIKTRIVRMDDGIVSTDFNFRINITNTSNKNLQNVSIVESIPKQLAPDSNKINFANMPKIIKQDPVVEWTIPILFMGSQTNEQYSISGIYDESILNDLNTFLSNLPTPTPTIPLTVEDEICKTTICNDDNPCTQDYCVRGNCFYSSKNGAICENGGVCQKTVCKEQSQSDALAEFTKKYEQLFAIFLAGIVVVIVILAGIFVFLIKNKKNKEPKTDPKKFAVQQTHYKYKPKTNISEKKDEKEEYYDRIALDLIGKKRE